MKKNTAGQKVGAQMITASDGSVFTGSVTVYVTGDAGTQAAGSVGSGACTHEGNGYHTYAPAQAETNYDLVSFTFIGTGAVAATVQVYPSFPQTGDSFGLIGATGSGLTSVASATDLATVAGYLDTEIAAIKAKTDNLPAVPASTTNITAGTITTVTNLTNLPAITANWLTAAGTAADFGAEIADAVWDEATAGHASAGSTGLALTSASAPTAAAVADAVWDEAISGHVAAGSTGEALSAAGGAGDPWITALPGAYSAGQAGKIVGDYLNATVSSRATQTSVDTIDGYLDTEIAAIKAKTDNLPAAPAAVGDIPTATQNADALLNRDMSAVSDTNARSPLNAMRFLRNKWSVAAGTLTVTKENDSTSAWTATISTDAAAVPVIGSDPA